MTENSNSNSTWGIFAAKMGQGLGQVKQFASERLGQIDPECITELPQDYLLLESKLDKIKHLYETFLRLSSHFSQSDYDPTVGETVREAVGKFNDLIIKPAASSLGQNQGGNGQSSSAGGVASTKEELPHSFAHALARTASDCALQLGEHEPLGACLKKFSVAQDRIGEARLKMEQEVNGKFVQPWAATLNTNIQFALKAKRQVQNCRMALDGAKSRMKNAKAERLPHVQTELTRAEEELNNAIKDATYKIHLVVDSPEPLRNLADLVNSQLSYFKAGFESLSSLSPEIDELQVTQEALFRSASSNY